MFDRPLTFDPPRSPQSPPAAAPLAVWLAALLLLPALALAGPPSSVSVAPTLAPGAWVHIDPATGILRAAYGLSTPTVGASPTERAQHFVAAHGAWLGGISPAQLRLEKVSTFRDEHSVAFQLLSSGLPLDGRFLTVSLDSAGRVISVSSDHLPVTAHALRTDVGAAAARAIALGALQGSAAAPAIKVVLAPLASTARVAYRVGVARIPLVTHYWVFVAADDGQVLSVRPAGFDQPREVLP